MQGSLRRQLTGLGSIITVIAALISFSTPSGASTTTNISRESVGSGSIEANDDSTNPAISGEGRYRNVAFESKANNLVAGDTNNSPDVFLRRGDTDKLITSFDVPTYDVDGVQTIPLVAGVNYRFKITGTFKYGVMDPSFVADAECSIEMGDLVWSHDRFSNWTSDPNDDPLDIYVSDGVANSSLNGPITWEPSGDTSGEGLCSVSHTYEYRLTAETGGPLQFWVYDFQNYWGDNHPGSVHVEIYEQEDTRTDITTIASAVHLTDVPGNGASLTPSISADGAVVAFASNATNLLNGTTLNDTNGFTDIYVRYPDTKEIERVSVSNNGIQPDANSYRPAVSSDGRRVAYDSPATNITPGNPPGYSRVWMRDIRDNWSWLVATCADNAAVSLTGEFVAYLDCAGNVIREDTWGLYAGGTTVSIGLNGTSANGLSNLSRPAISGDGRYVAFASAASNLVENDTNGIADVFVRDIVSGTTTLVSVAFDGAQANGVSDQPAISSNGRWVAFRSTAANVVPNDDNAQADIFVRDTLNNVTKRVSVSSADEQADGASSSPTVAIDGSTAFASSATNLISDDANGASDIFVNQVIDNTPPVISSFAANNNPFSPNADNTNDTTTFSAAVMDGSSVRWTLDIKDSSNLTVRSYGGLGSTIFRAWDGKNSSGVTQPDGAYTAALTVTDSQGHSSTASAMAVIDTSVPVVSSLVANNNPFSPNSDGTQDTTIFKAAVTDTSPVGSWTIEIKSLSGTLVKSFTGSGDPSQVWDGKNTSGTVVPDGDYAATVIVTDAQNLNSVPSSVTVTVDTLAPTISAYQASPTVFSPNDNGSFETATFSATFSEASSWTLSIEDSSNLVMRSYSGSGSSISTVWDGKDFSLTQTVTDGDYTARLRIETPAGNFSEALTTVNVDTTGPVASDYIATPYAFSPDGDGLKETTSISGTLSDSHGLSSDNWTMAIKSPEITHISFTGNGATVTQTWDGKDSNNVVLPDDDYEVELTSYDALLNESKNFTTVIVDNVAPEVDFEALPNPFSPNGDDMNDVTNFSAVLNQPSNPITWTLNIKDSQDVIIRSYSGTGSVPSQDWDGTDTNGIPMPDGTYTGFLTITDSQNHTTTAVVTTEISNVGYLMETLTWEVGNLSSLLPTPIPEPSPPSTSSSMSSSSTSSTESTSVEPPPIKQAFFNVPASQDRAITNRFIELIDQAAPEATIHIAMYEVSETSQALRIIRKLKEVHDIKGVKIKVVSEKSDADKNGTPAFNSSQLAAIADEKLCLRGCFKGASDPPDNPAIMHSKFMLIDNMVWTSRTDEKVMVQTSANWNGQLNGATTSSPTGTECCYNDMLVIWNKGGQSSTIYDLYLQYWNDLRACTSSATNTSWGCPNDSRYPSAGGDYTPISEISESRDAYPDTRMYLYPQNASSGEDSIEDVIENVKCTDSDVDNRKIWIAVWSLKNLSVAKELAAKKDSGCKVYVVFKVTDRGVINAFKAEGVSYKCHNYLHSKYLLMRSRYLSGSEVEENLWTGSHNYSNPAFKENDDAMVSVKSTTNQSTSDPDRVIFKNYKNNWSRIWNEGVGCTSSNIDD